jgi:hypothetical protein
MFTIQVNHSLYAAELTGDFRYEISREITTEYDTKVCFSINKSFFHPAKGQACVQLDSYYNLCADFKGTFFPSIFGDITCFWFNEWFFDKYDATISIWQDEELIIQLSQ